MVEQKKDTLKSEVIWKLGRARNQSERRSDRNAVGACRVSEGFCRKCFAEGYCQRLTTRVTSDAELRDTTFVFDVKTMIFLMNLGPKALRDYLVNVVRDMRGGFYDLGTESVEVLFDLQFLETEDGMGWLKELCEWNPGSQQRAHVRKERWEEFRAISSILRASDPIKPLGWGGQSSEPPLL